MNNRAFLDAALATLTIEQLESIVHKLYEQKELETANQLNGTARVAGFPIRFMVSHSMGDCGFVFRASAEHYLETFLEGQGTINEIPAA